MSRPYRLQVENSIYHVTSRGDDRKKIFISDHDYLKFLEYVSTAKTRFKFYLYAYCLMGNHYHLLFETTEANLSRIMQYINTSYTVYYNIKRKRCGHLFQGRYKSILVDADNYLLELTRYIHLNPVRAKIVDTPQKYRWSSYNEYLQKGKDSLIDNNQIKRYFKLSAGEYEQFVYEGIGETRTPYDKLHAGFIFGEEGFVNNALGLLKDCAWNKDFAHKKSIYGIAPGEIIQKVAKYYETDPAVLRAARKRPLLAKKVAVYLLKNLTALTNKEIGDEFGIGYSGVSWIAHDVGKLMEAEKGVKRDVEELISHLKV